MIFGITEDVDNNVWVLSLVPPRTLIRIYRRNAQEELPVPQIPGASSIVADPRGGIWLGLLNGDLARYQGGRTETFRFEHTPDSRVNQVLVSSDGSILGATAFGLIGWSKGVQKTLTAKNGLPCDRVNALVEDGSGAIWLYMQCGLVQIEKSELQRWWAQTNVRLQPKVFDVFDGLQPGLAPFRGTAKAADGRLWFANGSVLQMIDPAHLARNLVPPAVHVEQVIADRKLYSPQSDLRLPARTRDLEIEYTALSLTVPQKVRFRYRLEGRDTDWQDSGTRRQAFYTDLRPGPYRFHVIACNNDGVWNNEGAAFDFNIAAAWYQTSWFRGSCVAVFVLLLWALYQLRLHQLARQFNMRLEERVNERTRIARDLHDTLLQSFQGLMLRFQTVDEMLPTRPMDAKKALEGALDRADQALSEGRDAIQDIRTSALLSHDLAQSINGLMTDLKEEIATGNQDAMTFRVLVEGVPQIVRPVLRDEIYRIARESLRNAFRHAQARHIETEITYSEPLLRLRFRDDGKGIAPEILEHGRRSGHWGLPGMRERAKHIGGQLEVWSKPGAGTEVDLSIPGSLAYEALPRRAGFRLFRKRTGQNHEQQS
jgi:signal transduction histidine kinase